MTRVLITGANGYLGRALASRLVKQPGVSLTLIDLALDGAPALHGGRVCAFEGDLGDATLRRQAISPAPDIVYHLAGITSRQAQADAQASLRVNVLHTLALLEDLRRSDAPPVVVYASSIAVFGTPLPDSIDDRTPPSPTLTYGAHKQMVEIALADFSRRGELDGRSVRLPSVVARPAERNGALSGFASDLIRELAEGRSYTCPVEPQATLWLLSRTACIDALLHCAQIDTAALPASRAWNLPALRVRVDALVEALCRRFGADVARRIAYEPQPALEAQFACWPPLTAALAAQLGQRHDGKLDSLLERALTL